MTLNDGAKRKNGAGGGPLSKKSRSNSQRSNLSYEEQAEEHTEPPQVPAPTPNKEKYRNRIPTCLAVSPAGHPLKEFNSIKELLEALRDAIKARRLLLDGNILHRDISLNNIILTNPEEAGGFSGMLVDLDLAVIPPHASS